MNLQRCRLGAFLLVTALLGLSPLPAGGDDPAPSNNTKLSPELSAIIDAPEFKSAHWGILVVDQASGETIYELNADKLFAPASTTKLYSVAAALATLGADFRFTTPLVRKGEITADGELKGDLILVASGDFSLGGRTDPEGHIAFTDADHTYANGSSTTDLTAIDPLSGLDALAKMVAASDIRRVAGDVLIDTRLFDESRATGSGPDRVTPIVVNDNLIDVTITPGSPGSPAKIDYRPHCSTVSVDARVDTIETGKPSDVRITSVGEDKIIVRGVISADSKPLVRVHEVSDPASFARTLFIEALERAGVEVEASRFRPNDAQRLPTSEVVKDLPQVAVLKSPPFEESARLILKVSHNLHASMLPLLLAAKHGKRTLGDGLKLQHEFLTKSGVSADTISFGGGAGGSPADLTTPRATVELLRHMATRPDFAAYEAGLPVLGVDGTLATAVDEKSPAKGKAQAKTGTYYWQNLMNDRFVLTSKALAGYLTAKSGKRLVFAVMVNGVHIKDAEERTRIGKVLGKVCEVVYDGQ